MVDIEREMDSATQSATLQAGSSRTAPSDDIRIGWRFRVRKLCNGSYAAEARVALFFWQGIDLKAPGFTWSIGSRFYPDCIGTHQQCLDGIARYGG